MCHVMTYNVLAWSAEHPNQLRRASTIVAYRNDIAQWASLVLPHRLEDVDKVICSTPTRKDDNALGFEVAVAHLRRC